MSEEVFAAQCLLSMSSNAQDRRRGILDGDGGRPMQGDPPTQMVSVNTGVMDDQDEDSTIAQLKIPPGVTIKKCDPPMAAKPLFKIKEEEPETPSVTIRGCGPELPPGIVPLDLTVTERKPLPLPLLKVTAATQMQTLGGLVKASPAPSPVIATPTSHGIPTPTALPSSSNLFMIARILADLNRVRQDPVPHTPPFPAPKTIIAQPKTEQGSVQLTPKSVSMEVAPTPAVTVTPLSTKRVHVKKPASSPLAKGAELEVRASQPGHSAASMGGPMANGVGRIKTHKCDHPGCTKVYGKSSHLKAHQRTHTGKH